MKAFIIGRHRQTLLLITLFRAHFPDQQIQTVSEGGASAYSQLFFHHWGNTVVEKTQCYFLCWDTRSHRHARTHAVARTHTHTKCNHSSVPLCPSNGPLQLIHISILDCHMNSFLLRRVERLKWKCELKCPFSALSSNIIVGLAEIVSFIWLFNVIYCRRFEFSTYNLIKL